MGIRFVRNSRGRGHYQVWLIGSSIVSIVLAAGLLLVVRHRSSQLADPGLRIEPSLVTFGDRVFGDGEGVQARYRLVNSRDQPVTLRAVQASCSCMVTIAEDGRSFPLALGPNASVDFKITTTAQAARGVEQTYPATVIVEDETGTSRGFAIAMRFATADVLRAEPAALQALNAKVGIPSRMSLRLFTYRDPREISLPKVRVLGSKLIRAEVRVPSTKRDPSGKTLTRYVVDVTIEPDGDSGGEVRGELEIETTGEPLILVPVSCGFRGDVTFQPRIALASGRAGSTVDREVFQEFASGAWKDVEVVSKPVGCEVEVGRFDDRTNRIRLRLPIVDAAAAKADAFVVLRSRGAAQTARIPIRYLLE